MNMYNPCFECYNRYGHSYLKECDSICEYAHVLSKLKPYGGIDEVIKVMKGDAIPLVSADKEHIDSTYKFVCATKDSAI